jgi:integrase
MSDLQGYISKEQYDLLFDNCIGLKNRLLIIMLFHSGRRISELIQLKPKDINFNDGLIAWNILKKKAPIKKYIPIDDYALYYLYKYIEICGLTPDERIFAYTRQRADKIIKAIGKRAGIEIVGNKKIHAHNFRHGFAIYSLKQGANIREVQMSLDHSDLNMTAAYLQFTQEDLRNKMNMVFGIKKKEEN